MAKTLKEALLEQMAALQERGLAPGELPAETEEEPSYVYYDEASDRRAYGGDGDSDQRRGGRAPRVRTRSAPTGRTREHREPRDHRAHRERRPDTRHAREGAEALTGLPAPTPAPSPRPLRPVGGLPPRPVAGPMGPRPAPRSDMLRRNAERIQREQSDRDQVRQVLGQHSEQEIDDAAMEKFFSQLAVETGALPPIHVVVEALRTAGTADPAEVGNHVRLYYRRSRSRVGPRPVAVAP